MQNLMADRLRLQQLHIMQIVRLQNSMANKLRLQNHIADRARLQHLQIKRGVWLQNSMADRLRLQQLHIRREYAAEPAYQTR